MTYYSSPYFAGTDLIRIQVTATDEILELYSAFLKKWIPAFVQPENKRYTLQEYMSLFEKFSHIAINTTYENDFCSGFRLDAISCKLSIIELEIPCS